MNKIPLIKPYMTDAIKKRVCDVLDSGYLTEGPVTAEFEKAVKEYLGCENVIAVTSCTVGLEIALRALNIGAGDEVIVPDYTFPATADAVVIAGATPVIVDVSKDSMLIDYDEIETHITEKTKAIMPVSGFGNPLDYNRLNQIKEKSGIKIIEDAACSLGAEFEGRKIGNFADITVFSCHPRKFITTGEGGLIATNDNSLADWMLSYKHFGQGVSESRLTTEFVRIGTNYKLSNVLAAIGLGQMEVIDDLLANRRELANNYLELLKNVEGIRIPHVVDGGIHSYQSFCIFIPDRDRIMAEMRNVGIEVQIGTYSLHMHEAFKGFVEGKEYLNSRSVFSECLTLPLYNELEMETQQKIVNELIKKMKPDIEGYNEKN